MSLMDRVRAMRDGYKRARAEIDAGEKEIERLVAELTGSTTTVQRRRGRPATTGGAAAAAASAPPSAVGGKLTYKDIPGICERHGGAVTRQQLLAETGWDYRGANPQIARAVKEGLITKTGDTLTNLVAQRQAAA